MSEKNFGTKVFYPQRSSINDLSYISNMSLLLGIEPFQKFGVGGGGGWSKGILEFRRGPNLGLRLEAGTKLNNISSSISCPHDRSLYMALPSIETNFETY